MKKMKKALLLVIVAMIAVPSFGQSRQERKQIRLLDKEILKNQKEVSRLKDEKKVDYSEVIKNTQKKIDSLQKEFNQAASLRLLNSLNSEIKSEARYKSKLEEKMVGFDKNKFIEIQIQNKEKLIVELQNQRNLIFDRYATTTEIPKEVSRRTFKLRGRSNILRREELSLKKTEIILNSSIVDSSNSQCAIKPSGKKIGYKVLIDNEYWRAITFEFVPIDGGEFNSANVKPTRNSIFTEIYLLPGTYEVRYKNGGEEIFLRQIMHIDGVVRNYQGQDCFNFAWTASTP